MPLNPPHISILIPPPNLQVRALTLGGLAH